MNITDELTHLRCSENKVKAAPFSLFPPSLPPSILTSRKVRKVRISEQRRVAQELVANVGFGGVERAGMMPIYVFDVYEVDE